MSFTRPTASKIQTKGGKNQTKQTQYQTYWQCCSIRVSMTIISTSALCCPLSLSKPYFEPRPCSCVSASPSFAPTPFHKGGMVASAQLLCSSTGTSRKQAGFCISSLWLVTHHLVREKGMRWETGDGVVYVDLKTQGRKKTFWGMEISIGERASCSKWREAHILWNLAGVEDLPPGKKMQNRDLSTQLGDSLYHKMKSWGDFWDQLNQAPPVITCLQQQLRMIFCLFFNRTLTEDSWIFNILLVQL